MPRSASLPPRARVASSPTVSVSQPSLRTASEHLHATPHSPKPALSMTEPLLMSATASSALLHSFEPPRLTSAAFANRSPLDCEKPRLPARPGLVVPDGALAVVGVAQAAAAHRSRGRVCLASIGAVGRTARATPAILSFDYSRAVRVRFGNPRRLSGRSAKEHEQTWCDVCFSIIIIIIKSAWRPAMRAA